jgi:hypothetical protein
MHFPKTVIFDRTSLIRALRSVLFFLLPLFTFTHHTAGQVLDFATDVRLENEKLVTERSILIQINNRDMDWLSDIAIPYQQGDKVDILEASIVSTEGKVLRSIGKKEITSRHNISDGAFFEDDWVMEFGLKWNQYPYRIKYKYRTSATKSIYLCRWYPLLYTNVEVKKATLKINHAKELQVAIFQTHGVHGDSALIKNQVIRSWEFTNVGRFKKEPLSPPVLDLLPCIIVAPKNFHYGIDGSLESWAAYGQWQDQLNSGTDDLPLYEQQKLTQLLKDESNKTEIIKKLYHYMQDNTRYINVAIDVGGLKPFPASYVSTKKYGDCKALTVFMKSLLNFAGIPSYYTKINGAINPTTVRTEIPGPQFNHIVLCIPLGRDTVWLENTANYLPYNYLGTFTQNRPALVVNGENSRLIRTPALTPEHVHCSKRFDFFLKKDGSGSATAEWELRGEEFETVRHLQVNEKENDLTEAIQGDFPRNSIQLSHWNATQATRDSPALKLNLELTLNDQLRFIGNSIVIKPLAFYDVALEEPGSRTTPVRINYPVSQQQTLKYHLDFREDYSLTLPKDKDVRTSFGQFHVRYIKDGPVITIERTLTILAGSIAKDKYSEFYNFIQTIKEANRESAIVLDPKP